MAFGDDLDIIRNKMKTNVDSFKLNECYKLDKAKALMVITPNQLIITEVRSHNIGLKAISYLLYGKHARCETYSIVVRLDSNGDNKLFIPIFPSGSISSFQAEVLIILIKLVFLILVVTGMDFMKKLKQLLKIKILMRRLL